jgi:hypothetical protein
MIRASSMTAWQAAGLEPSTLTGLDGVDAQLANTATKTKPKNRFMTRSL